MKEDRTRILGMLQDGSITVEQADRLLEALEQGQRAEAAAAPAAQQVDPGAQGKGVAGGGLGGAIANTVGSALRGVFGGLSGATKANFSSATLTKEGLARLPDATDYTNFGSLSVANDVPEELLRQKIRSLTNFGSVAGPPHLTAVLEAVCDTNFGSIGSDDEGPAGDEGDPGAPTLTNVGRIVLTEDQLRHMADGSTYKNIGRLVVAGDVSEDLLLQKIAVYKNIGRTQGPTRLLAVLQARCPKNIGRFEPTDGPEVGHEEEA